MSWENAFYGRLDLSEGSRDRSCTGTAGCAYCGSVAGHLAHEIARHVGSVAGNPGRPVLPCVAAIEFAPKHTRTRFGGGGALDNLT